MFFLQGTDLLGFAVVGVLLLLIELSGDRGAVLRWIELCMLLVIATATILGLPWLLAVLVPGAVVWWIQNPNGGT